MIFLHRISIVVARNLPWFSFTALKTSCGKLVFKVWYFLSHEIFNVDVNYQTREQILVNHREPGSDKGPRGQYETKLTKIKPLCKTNRSKHFDDRAGKVSLVALITMHL